jgi:hypothetical protein
LSTSTSIPRLWPATLFDAASDPLAAAFKKRLPRTTNDVCLLPEEAGSCALRLLFLSSDRQCIQRAVDDAEMSDHFRA